MQDKVAWTPQGSGVRVSHSQGARGSHDLCPSSVLAPCALLFGVQFCTSPDRALCPALNTAMAGAGTRGSLNQALEFSCAAIASLHPSRSCRSGSFV